MPQPDVRAAQFRHTLLRIEAMAPRHPLMGNAFELEAKARALATLI